MGAILVSTAPTAQAVRILEFIALDTGVDFLITTEYPIADSATTFTVYNPTSFAIPSYPYIFIPTSVCIPNYYNKYLMYNQTHNNYANIVSYNGETHVAQLSDITGLGWNTSDVYVVRQTLPRNVGTVVSATANTITFSFVLDSTYLNNFVRVFKINSTLYQLVRINNDTTKYDPIAKKYYYTVTASVTPSFSTIPTNAYTYEILQFDIDNVSPFVYNGTMSSQSQPVANEITLNSLTLPNTSLKSGGRIAYYPYVYVELDNVSSTSNTTKNIIYSNNPHTYKAVFKVPITDLNHPLQSPFVKLTGNGMKQTIVFKQNDDMKITVKLPNGDLFTTITPDNFFGNLPNSFLQISAVFGIEKV